MILHDVVIKPLISHPDEAGMDYAGFSPDQRGGGGGRYSYVACLYPFDHRPRTPFEAEHRSYSK